jgi:lysophospholipase L1-like esterase
MRAVPEDATSSAKFELALDAVRGKARWDVAFRLPSPRARFSVTVTGGECKQVDVTTAAVGTIAHVALQTERGATVTLGHAAFDPELFGVTIEGTEPGIVVDTLGINGARIGTPLAWEAEPWISEIRLRNPALFVLAYGTNEVGDQVAPFRYAPELESLVERVRKGAPSADCLVVGPTDREGPGWTPLPRVLEIEAVERQTAERMGCAFWSAVEAMGGEGGLRRWAELDPPLGAPDRVHLTPKGYGELGTMMARILLEGG